MEIVYHLPCTRTHLSLRLGFGSGARVWAEPARKPIARRPVAFVGPFQKFLSLLCSRRNLRHLRLLEEPGSPIRYRTVMKNSACTIGTALLAAAAGAGVALLFAPDSGGRTRRLTRFNAESFAKDLRDEVNASAAALYGTGAASTRRALRRLGKAVNQRGAGRFRLRLQTNAESRSRFPTPRLPGLAPSGQRDSPGACPLLEFQSSVSVPF
jgi:gas vesicle protein